MKKQKTLFYLFITIIFAFNIACQDRLIVLWDEEIKPLLISNSMQIITGEDAVSDDDYFIAQENQTESPVDIVMVIDNSSSMSDEIDAVRSYINTLSTQLDNSNIDYRFVMISLTKNNGDDMVYFGIDVPAPLGTSNRFKHIDKNVSSRSALGDIIGEYSNYSNL